MSEEKMITKFIQEGCKIELQALERSTTLGADAPLKTYVTKIYEILTEDTLEVLMPMEQGKLILLPVDQEFDAVLYGMNGLYQCVVRVIDRYKTGNLFLLQLEFASNLRKFQRRDFYRFSCALEMTSRNLEEEEMVDMEQMRPGKELNLQPGLPLERSVIVDISGGGLRFVSTQKYEVDSFIYCNYTLIVKGERKKYNIVGKVLAAKEVENRKGSYEHRVQYYNIPRDVQEEIIKYIFEEERKSLKK